jgi:hypothetical protein
MARQAIPTNLASSRNWRRHRDRDRHGGPVCWQNMKGTRAKQRTITTNVTQSHSRVVCPAGSFESGPTITSSSSIASGSRYPSPSRPPFVTSPCTPPLRSGSFTLLLLPSLSFFSKALLLCFPETTCIETHDVKRPTASEYTDQYPYTTTLAPPCC